MLFIFYFLLFGNLITIQIGVGSVIRTRGGELPTLRFSGPLPSTSRPYRQKWDIVDLNHCNSGYEPDALDRYANAPY